MKQLTLMLALFVLAAGAARAQVPVPVADKIQFEKTTHEFGKIPAGSDGSYTFSFTNTSAEPVKLSSVKASCGCTTPSWSQESIPSGAKGQIQVSYDTKRVGPFTKSITVLYEGAINPTYLYITGEVLAPEPNDADIYIAKQGALAFDTDLASFGTVDTDKSSNLTFRVKNMSDKPVKINKIESDPGFVVTMPESELSPGQKTEISIRIEGSAFSKSETYNGKVVLHTDDAQGESKSLNINGNINKIFTAEELAKMPNIVFERPVYEGGSIIEGEKLKISYKFKNTGGSDLLIESVKASCGCTAAAPKEELIRPGEESVITAEFDSRGRLGVQQKSIMVRTNDPDEPVINLRFSTEVVRDPFHSNSNGPANNPFGSGY